MATVEREAPESDEIEFLLAALEVRIHDDECNALSPAEKYLARLHRKHQVYLAERRKTLRWIEFLREFEPQPDPEPEEDERLPELPETD